MAAVQLLLFTHLPALQLSRIIAIKLPNFGWRSGRSSECEHFTSTHLPSQPWSLGSLALLPNMWKLMSLPDFTRCVCPQLYWITRSICNIRTSINWFNKKIELRLQNDQVACLLQICQAVKFLKKIRSTKTSATVKSQQNIGAIKIKAYSMGASWSDRFIQIIHCPLVSGWIRTMWSSAS